MPQNKLDLSSLLGAKPSYVSPEDYDLAGGEMQAGGDRAANMARFLAAIAGPQSDMFSPDVMERRMGPPAQPSILQSLMAAPSVAKAQQSSALAQLLGRNAPG